MKNTNKIKSLVDAKPFTPVPTPIREYMTQKTASGELSLQDTGAWMLMYLQAEYRGMRITGGYHSLCAILGASAKTVQRILIRLERAGMVMREYHRSHHPGHAAPRTRLVSVHLTVPDEIDIIADATKDRSARSHSSTERSPVDKRKGEKTSMDTIDQVQAKNMDKPDRQHYRSGKSDHNTPPRPALKNILSEIRRQRVVGDSMDNRLRAHEALIAEAKARESTTCQHQTRNAPRNPYPLPTHITGIIKAGLKDGNARLADEVAYSVMSGRWRCPKEAAVKICLNLIESGKWKRPYGMV